MTPENFALLELLDENRGSLTSEVSHVVFGSDRRQQSANANYRLRRLAVRGYVRRFDDQKPVRWCRTPSGTEALAARKGE